MLRERHYDLVLSEFMLSDGTAYQLMSCLRGTDTMMFFFNVVEQGCWWINAISEGQDHSDGPGMRPEEFKILLDETLLDRHLRNANQRRCRPPSGSLRQLSPAGSQRMKEKCHAKNQF